MKVADLALVILPLALRAVREHPAQTFDRSALPRAHLVRMHLALRGDLLNRLVAPQCLQRNPRLELPSKPTSRTHLVFLHHPVEYTLTYCPVFQDCPSSDFLRQIAVRRVGGSGASVD